MKIPNVAEFGAVAFTGQGIRLMCPECGSWVNVTTDIVWPTIRDLIAAATEHNTTTHALSVPHARIGA